MRANQVGVIDVGVVDVLTRLHLRLQLLYHIALLNEVVVNSNTGDFKESLSQRCAFILVGCQRFGDHIN